MDNKTLTSIKGISVGHSTHLDKLTGCTLIKFDKPTLSAYKSFGGGISDFNLASISPDSCDYYIDGVFFTGGSTYGLGSIAGINDLLIKKYKLHGSHSIYNPQLVGAVVYDMGTRVEQFKYEYGIEAVNNLSNNPVELGNVGAGTGTAVGKFSYANDGEIFSGSKAGIGSATIDVGKGIYVSALSVVNAGGNIVLPNGEILAGNRSDKGDKKFKDFNYLTNFFTKPKKENTTLTIVGTNYDLRSRENVERLALFGTHGQSRAIHPVNLSIDGDLVIAFSTQEITNKIVEFEDWKFVDIDMICEAGARAVQESIYSACYNAKSIKVDWAWKGIVPTWNEIN